jgi:hypothetical protein
LTDDTDTGAAKRWPLALALVLSVLLVVGVLAAAAVVRGHRSGPLALDAVAAPAAGSPHCSRLLAALPDELDGGAQGALARRQLVAPAPAGVVAWGEPPVVLRCGVSRPAQLTLTSRLLVVSGVQFLQVPGTEADTWVAVDRPVYVAVALPVSSGSAPLQQLTEQIRKTMPAQQIELAR